MTDLENLERFRGIRALYGEDGFNKLQQAHVLIIGTGGVGSWLCEALCRSGVGKLSLIDPDIIEVGNSNRQLHTTSKTLGQNKAKTLALRLQEINPNIEIEIIDTYLTPENIDTTLKDCPLYVAEAIDDPKAKAYLVNYLVRNKRKFITAGGAGGRKDPSRLKLDDLKNVKGNALLNNLRHDLVHKYGFNKDKKMKVACVYSDEEAVYSKQHSTDTSLPKFGAAMAVTASCGLMMAAYLIDKIVKK